MLPSKRTQAVGLGGAPNPDRPTFVVSLPPIATVVQRRSPGPAPAPIPRPGSGGYRRAPIPRSPRGTRRRPSGFVVKWSGIDMTTEYPVYNSDDDSEDGGDTSAWETIQEPSTQEDGVSTHLASYDPSKSQVASPTTASTTSSTEFGSVVVLNPEAAYRQPLQDLWHLAGPLHGMTNLPIEATKQNAMLVHTCWSTTLRLWLSAGGT